MAGGGRTWIAADSYGRIWRLTVPRARVAPTAWRATGPSAVIDDLVNGVLAPWGTATQNSLSDLLEIHLVITGCDLSREYLSRRRGETGWRHRLDVLRHGLLDAARTGWLLCESTAPPPSAVVDDIAPETIREPTFPAPESATWFELRVVDEAGHPIAGLDVAFAVAGDREAATTNDAGVARAFGLIGSFGSARLVSSTNVKEELDRRWAAFRPLRIPGGDDVTVQRVRDSLAAISLESETPRTLVVVPHHRRVRLIGMHFDTNKCFLLPSAMRGIRRIKSIYDEIDTTEILVVGHTDDRGQQSYNEKLSLERAEAVAAFMKDDVDTWNAWFSTPETEKRWGAREIDAMLATLPEGEPPFTTTGAGSNHSEIVRHFQRWSNETRGTSLLVDGITGNQTRRALIEAYMALDHTTLPCQARVIIHGCGPHQPPFASNDVERTTTDLRRVDIFAFEGTVRPTPPGPTSGPGAREYPTWVAQMESTIDVEAEESATYALVIVDEHDRALAGLHITVDGAGFRKTAITDARGAADFAGAPMNGLTAWIDGGLAETLAPLVSAPPRDREYPATDEYVVLTPSQLQRGFDLRANGTIIVMVVARTDVTFSLPKGWEGLEVDAEGPWHLSSEGERARLSLVSDGIGRKLTLRCPATPKQPFTGTFPPSPLWSADKKRILQAGETLLGVAKRYLSDEVCDTLLSLNPQLVAVGGSAREVSPGTALLLPAESLPAWLSIPDEVTASRDDATSLFDTFTTIEIDTLHDALFTKDNAIVWGILSRIPTHARNNESKPSDDDYLTIYTQCMNTEMASTGAAHDD